VRNSRFEKNRGAGQGGAIVAWGYNQDRILIEDSEIINNEVIKNQPGINQDSMAQGGGLWLMGFVEMNNNIISNNKSADLGGGTYIWGELSASISDSDFSGNQASQGGAIYDGLWASKLDINSTNFDSNFATNQGGAFYSKNNVPLTLRNSQFNNNTPDKPSNYSPGNNLSEIISGSNNDDTILGTKQNNYLLGLQGNDLLSGLEGDDSLDGGKSFDTLMGGDGKDTLVGGDGINSLNGGNDDDFLVGGNGQDLMQGGSGGDTFVIGDKTNHFYNSYGWYDRALIKDFQAQKDTIQLKGKASDYKLRSLIGSGVSSTGIFYNNELVALVEGVSANNFNLTADYITYK
jgi:predicted outer membrane repeat protein